MSHTPMKVEVPKDFIHSTGILDENLNVSNKPALEEPSPSKQGHSPMDPPLGKK